MELTPIYKRVIGLDIHQAKISACAVAEQADGKVTVESREFGGFKRDRRALAEWAKSFGPEVVVMESTGIYCKSPYAALENVGIAAWVVNARHVKTVPGRKTDVADAQWLATLARAGLLRASFIPQADIPLPAPDCAPAPKAGRHAGVGEEPAAQTACRRRYPAQCAGIRYSRSGRSCHGQSADRGPNHPANTGLGGTFARQPCRFV